MKYKLPENLSALTSLELKAEQDKILEEYAALAGVEAPTKEQAAAIVELGTALTTVKTRRAEVETEEAAADQALAEAKAALEEAPEDEPAEPEKPAEPEPETEKPAEDAPAEDAPAEEKEAVLASGKPRAGAGKQAAAASKKIDDPDLEADVSKISMVAAAGVRTFASGQELEGVKDLSEAWRQRGLSIRPSRGASSTERFAVASVHRPQRPESERIVIDGEQESVGSAFSKLIGVSRQAERASYDELQAITAAAFGWVTPSENTYDIPSWAKVDGILQLPHIDISRGGLNHIDPTFDYDVVFDDADGSFVYTESQMEGNPTKPLLELTAPEWEDIRLDSFGWGIKLPIPLKSSFPELIEWYMENALVAYQHKLNANKINRVLTYLGSAVDFHEHGSAASDLLESIEVAVWAFRYKYRLNLNATVQGMAPAWIKAAVRIDLSRRNGYDNPLDVTDGMIESWFKSRGVQFQYIVDWSGQDLTGTQVNLPSSVQVGLWVPGTYVEGGDEIFSVDAVYDTAGITKNEYLGAFFEESLLVANIHGQGRLETIGLNYYGMSGANTLGDPDLS